MPDSGPTRGELEQCAHEALLWIRSVALDVDGGLGWREDGQLSDDLYSGTAGVLLGCAEAAAYGVWRRDVAAGAVSRLLHLLARDRQSPTLPDDGVFSGWAGVVVALHAWSQVAGDARAAAGASEAAAGIAGRVLQAAPDPARCTDVISGDAGLLLALLTDGSPVALAAVEALADHLVAAAEPGPDGLQWRMTPDGESLMPGFSHGTAGVGYALARAGDVLGRPDLVKVAARGAQSLLALGSSPDGWALPTQVPTKPGRPLVSFGWCHGPTGTARLFLALDAIDPQPRWQQAADACLTSIADSGLPARRHAGFWDNLARCCGSAGVGQLLLDRHRATGDPASLALAGVLAADVVSRAVRTPDGVCWSNTEHTRDPAELAPEPGYMQGAAGIVGWLARLHATTAPGPASRRPEPSWV